MYNLFHLYRITALTSGIKRDELIKLTHTIELTQTQLLLIKDKFKDFAARMKFEPPAVQHLMLLQYVHTIIQDKSGEYYNLQFHIDYPIESEEIVFRVLEKNIYITLD